MKTRYPALKVLGSLIFGLQTFPMAAAATMGLAVTSHADGTLCTSTMDNVTATP